MNELIAASPSFGLVISLLAYEVGLILRKKFKLAIFNPLLIAIGLIIAFLACFDVSYEHYMQGAQYLAYLLTPATVCLAVPLYRQLEVLKRNWAAILLALSAGVLSSLSCVYLMARLFALPRELYVTLLPKSITTAIGMGVSEELGGYVTITVFVIILTGVLGHILAELLCRAFRLHDPIAKGLALGCSAHAIGTTKAMEMGEVEAAMSSLAIVLSGLLTVIFASFFARLPL